MGVQDYNVLIIGGGAAGIMAAITAKRKYPEYSVGIIDRTFALGRKILVAGAGRCNLTNLNLDKSFSTHYYCDDPRLVESTFTKFGFQEIVKFFEELGIELYVERKTDIGKLFPITDQAKTVNTLLQDELERLGVDIHLNTAVTKITKPENSFLVTTDKGNYQTDKLIIAAGGKTYPALGSDGSGYTLAKSLGHNIIDPVPAALPLVAKNQISQEAHGVKLDVEVSSHIDNQKVKTSVNELMFTQYGLSGPAILNISREISIHLNRNDGKNVFVTMNFFPGKNSEQIEQRLKSRWQARPNQTLELSLFGYFPPKFPAVFLKSVNMDPTKLVGSLTAEEVSVLVKRLSEYRINISGTRGWNEAEFTAGGVDISQVNTSNLESKIVNHLYFCGEILDVDGDVGGFNLSWAWSSGNLAGQLLPATGK